MTIWYDKKPSMMIMKYDVLLAMSQTSFGHISTNSSKIPIVLITP